jgi:hypothetical protein
MLFFGVQTQYQLYVSRVPHAFLFASLFSRCRRNATDVQTISRHQLSYPASV